MWRTLTESRSGSYAGRIAPPGMPKTVSTSIASRESTRLCAPVTSMGVRARACCATCAGLGALGGAGLVGATGIAGFVSLIGVTVSRRRRSVRPSSVHKKPSSPGTGRRRERVCEELRRAVEVRGLGPRDHSPAAPRTCQPARRPVPRSGTMRPPSSRAGRTRAGSAPDVGVLRSLDPPGRAGRSPARRVTPAGSARSQTCDWASWPSSSGPRRSRRRPPTTTPMASSPAP